MPSWHSGAHSWHSALGQLLDFPFRSVLTWEMCIRILGFILLEILMFLALMIAGGMDGMLKQTSRKSNTSPQKPQIKPKSPSGYGEVRSYTMNAHTVLLHSFQSGLQHLENFPLPLGRLQSHILCPALAQNHWAFCPYPIQGPAEAVFCLQSLFSWCFFFWIIWMPPS